MIWLAWRQFRAQAIVVLVLLGAVGVYLGVTGVELRHSYDSALADGVPLSGLLSQYRAQLLFADILLAVAPGLLGAFWGAPLVARELETGTHQLIWNQTVTRTRWLAVKLAVVGLTALAVTGVLSLLVTWWAAPLDRIHDERFTPAYFDSRGVAPLGYVLFALAVGTCAGLLIRRSVPAVAAAVAVFAAVQVAVPLALRPHLEPPVHSRIALTADVIDSAKLIGFTGGTGPDAPFVANVDISGAWVVSGAEQVVDPADQRLTKATMPCGRAADWKHCLAGSDLRVPVSYQPADRYWTFQWIETAIYLALALGVAALSGRWLRRRLS